MIEFLDIAWEDFTTEYMFITFLVFTSVWIFYFFPRSLPRFFYGIYRKGYVSKEEKDGIKFTIEPTSLYKTYGHNSFTITKQIDMCIGLEDYFFKRRHRDMRFEKAMGLPYWFKVLGCYRKLAISNVEENINSVLQVNKRYVGLILNIPDIDFNKLEIRFKLKRFVHSCYFNHKGIDKLVKELPKMVMKTNEFQDHMVMNILLREYGIITVTYEGKLMKTYNKCFEIIKTTGEA